MFSCQIQPLAAFFLLEEIPNNQIGDVWNPVNYGEI